MSNIFQPSPNRNPSRRRRCTTRTSSVACEALLRNLSTPGQWRRRQAELGICSAERYKQVIDLLMYGDLEGVKNDVLVYVQGSSIKDGQLQKCLSRFKTFLLLSLAIVRSNMGMGHGYFDSVAQKLVLRQKDRNTMRRQIIEVNKLVNTLVGYNWSIHRATELLFLNALSKTQLERIDTKSALKRFVDRDIASYDFSDCLVPEYTVPGLVRQMAGTADMGTPLSLTEICINLGYTERCGISTCPGLTSKTYAPIAEAIVCLSLFLDGTDIPISLFSLSSCHQTRWKNSGEKAQVAPPESGVHPLFARSLSDHRQLELALHQLSTYGDIRIDGPRRTISQAKEVRGRIISTLSPGAQAFWKDQACALVRHAFPRGEALDSAYKSTGSTFTKQLLHFLSYRPVHHSADLAAALLAALELQSTTKRNIVDAVQDILAYVPPSYLHFWIARFQISNLGRNNSIVPFLYTQMHGPIALDARTNAHLGRIHVCRAAHLMRRNQLDNAASIISSWKPLSPNNPSPLEQIADSYISLTLGRILHFQGHLPSSYSRLHSIRKVANIGLERKLACSMAEVLLDMGDSEKCQRLLERTKKCFSTRRSLLNYQVRMAESYLWHDRFQEAKELFSHVQRSCHGETALDEMLYIIACTGIAKVKHKQFQWEEAIAQWKAAEEAIRRFGWGDGAASTLVSISISHILATRNQNWTGWQDSLNFFSDTNMENWMPGMMIWRGWLRQSASRLQLNCPTSLS